MYKQWLAVVRGKHWVVAQVARRKLELDILRLSEFHVEPESEGGQEQHGENTLAQKESFQEDKSLSGGKKADLLKAWLLENRVPLKKLRLAVSCPGVITRMITLPLISARDLDRLLTEQVEQYFTLNIADYVVDYRVLDRIEEEGEMRQRVLLAALPKYQWESLWSEWAEIGFQPQVVDLTADALARLYSNITRDTSTKKSTIDFQIPLDLAIVELSADRVEFVLLEQGVFFLYSDLEVSLAGLDEVIRAMNGTAQELRIGQTEESEDTEDTNLQTAQLQVWARTEIETTLRNVLQSLAEFFRFFAARHFGKSIDQIYITGDYSDLPFLQAIFESNLEVATRVGFPNAWRPRFSKTVSTLEKNGLKYGSLYGLAMREG